MLRNPLGCGKSPLGPHGTGAGSPRDAAYTAVIRSLLRQSPRTRHYFSDHRSAQQHSLQNRRGIAGQVDVELEGVALEHIGIVAEDIRQVTLPEIQDVMTIFIFEPGTRGGSYSGREGLE